MTKELLYAYHCKDPNFKYNLKVVKSHFSEGKGGQNINRHMNGVRLFHEESGIIVTNHDTRSEPDNHRRASEEMAKRLSAYYTKKIEDHFGKPNFKSNDRIRTYNEKRSLCVDHRTNKSYPIDKSCTLEPKFLDKIISDNNRG